MIDRQIFFDSVRPKPFGGKLSQSQVDGMGYILDAYEMGYADWDLRWLAYAFATTFHETSKEMQPISEYGKGSGAAYGKPDPPPGSAITGAVTFNSRGTRTISARTTSWGLQAMIPAT